MQMINKIMTWIKKNILNGIYLIILGIILNLVWSDHEAIRKLPYQQELTQVQIKGIQDILNDIYWKQIPDIDKRMNYIENKR